ncbi:MAG: NUDIX hydrolase [Candidatus Hodarchaeales archaeon]|jgi:8-oxo-dGTP pyrophosphatase MutT (NUDIX family)
MPIEPKLAATVVLLRERSPGVVSDDDCEFEVFMAKRHKDTKFMSEHHVFPGGALDDQDLTNESKARVIGIDETIIANLTEICEDPINLWIIAIRELFEETGVLIAATKTGNLLGRIEEKPKKLKKYQKKLQKKSKTMTDVLNKENLYYAANNLRYFGRLITPEISPIRFDTQFFICKFPQNQYINLFTDELTEYLWGSPKKLLELFKNRHIKLIFPQYSTLQRLQEFKTIQEVFENSKHVSSHNRLNEL